MSASTMSSSERLAREFDKNFSEKEQREGRNILFRFWTLACLHNAPHKGGKGRRKVRKDFEELLTSSALEKWKAILSQYHRIYKVEKITQNQEGNDGQGDSNDGDKGIKKAKEEKWEEVEEGSGDEGEVNEIEYNGKEEDEEQERDGKDKAGSEEDKKGRKERRIVEYSFINWSDDGKNSLCRFFVRIAKMFPMVVYEDIFHEVYEGSESNFYNAWERIVVAAVKREHERAVKRKNRAKELARAQEGANTRLENSIQKELLEADKVRHEEQRLEDAENKKWLGAGERDFDYGTETEGSGSET
jgi:hypothetical protein